jgi:hypothetical protein
MAGRQELLVAQKVAEIDQRIVELSLILRELKSPSLARPARAPRR